LIERRWQLVGWWALFVHDFLTYFELDELINDYEVTTVSGLIMTELSHIQNREKNWFGKIWIRGHRYGWREDW
jgi:CBS domain containing-hemolysin-like protein